MTKLDARSSGCVAIEREVAVGSWVIDVEQKVAGACNPTELSGEESEWQKPSIFRLPDFVRKMKPEVFTPQVVALGPFHHNKSHLQPLETHKQRALLNFLKRKGGKPLGDYVRALENVVGILQDSYFDLGEEWRNRPDEFLKLMITDGCFMLEVMRLDEKHCKHYAPSDPFFGPHALQHKVPYIRRDMLILENQVPLLLLRKLIAVEKDVNDEAAAAEIAELVIKFLFPSINVNQTSLKDFQNGMPGLHVLDIYRRIKLYFPAAKPREAAKERNLNFAVMRSAVELHEAGVSFRRSLSPTLTDIHFDSWQGVLTLPPITVDDTSEYEFLNMVALEHLHTDSGSEVSSYVVFMDALVDSAKDVQLLHEYRLLYNGLGSDKDLAKLFSSMSKEVIVDQGGSLGHVQAEVEKYCQKRWKRWRANLNHTYFKNPWSVCSVIAAAFVILLTIVSTVFTILQWVKS